MMKKRIDPLTYEEFVPKSIIQKFKNPQNQIKYNNKLQSKRRKALGSILKPMQKTHRILTKALGDDESVRLHHQWLKGAGADMASMTHIETEGEKRYSALFDFKIEAFGNYYIIQKLKK
jgi:hypothetical protein